MSGIIELIGSGLSYLGSAVSGASAGGAAAGSAGAAGTAGTAAAATGTAATGATAAAGSTVGSYLVGTAATSTAAETAGIVGAGGHVTAGGLLSSAANVASLAGTGLSVISQLQGGKSAAEVAKLNARLAESEAMQQREATKSETLKLSREANRMYGEQVSGYGASGITMEGSPLEVMANTAKQYERDILYTGYAGDVAAGAKINQAAILDWQGKQELAASKWKAGTTLLTGLGEYGMSRVGSLRKKAY
jgi:hypothetical protein